MFELRINHDGKEWQVPLAGSQRWRIGRSEDCEISVPDRRVSSEHAELTLADGKLTLRRTTGQRQIEIDGRPVESAELGSGSSFNIGTTNFIVVAAKDGMNLIDAQTVLGRTWADPAGSGTSIALPRPAAHGAPMRLFAQFFALLTKAGDRNALNLAVLELACQRLMATRALLAKIEDAQSLKIIASSGLPLDPGTDLKSLISTTVLKQIIDERQAVIIGNTAVPSNGIGQQASIIRNHIRAVACTPVFDSRGQLISVLYVDNQDRPAEFSAQEAELLIWLGQIYSLLDENLDMRRRLEAEVSELKRSAVSGVQLVAETPVMIQLLERVKKVAASEAAVLVLGESGTGKECIARMLHQLSPHSGKPFVARNCAAIPENLFESEMFGHKKGAFTGAESDRKGAFAEADGGTLFLDEIGDLSYVLQTKLLRAIQERTIRPVGSDKDIPVNVRIVCATNRDLRECLKTREFREDLFYRLATVTLTLPPLRERKDDIVPLARHFVRLLSGGTRSLAAAAEERLLGWEWPGNVRELRSSMEQAVIFAGGNEIQPDDLSLPGSHNGRIDLSPQSLAEVERRHILQVLGNASGNKTEAAKILGLARSTLVLKLQSYEKLKK